MRHDSKVAWVTLQENNAIAEIDLRTLTVTRLIGLGFKDHSLAGNGLDPSDRDGPSNGPAVKIGLWPVRGMYQPDAIAAFHHQDKTYYLTANEGDVREWFDVKADGRQEGLDWVLVVPKQGDADFRDARLGFGNGELKRMVLNDKLGQTVRLEFYASERNPPVADAEVTFVPPAGADVIGTPES